IALMVVLLMTTPGSADPEAAYDNMVVPSWGDSLVAYGPGTDPAMDTPDALRNMIKHWKGRGYTGLLLRTDLVQLGPEHVHLNPVAHPNPRLAWFWRHTDEIAESFDLHGLAQQFCDRDGLDFWAWHPHLYSDGAPEDVGTPGVGRMIPWRYVSTYTHDHPEVITVDRAGNMLWMVREYAYPGARASKIAEFVHMAREQGIRGFLACMRSEVSQLVDPPDKADRFGFNEPVVADMKRLHGVDILTDARFDVDSPTFDPLDQMLEKWRDLRGGYVTQFFRELRAALDDVDPEIHIAVTLSGDHVGPPLGNWRLDWRAWVDEGLVDEIVNPVFFEATFDHEAHLKDYLTDVRGGKGTVSYAALSDYIAHSERPGTKVIATGAYPYFAATPPEGADGWRTDVWYDSYHLAWFQRWRQWRKDLDDFGCIKFLEQDFNDAPLAGESDLDAWGNPAHVPSLRACPGGWYKLGHGDDSSPTVQETVRRGAGGRAVRLTSSADGGGGLTGWHNSAPDRSTLTTSLDNAIANGRCALKYWLYRESEASGLAAFLQSDGAATDVGLRVAGGTGALSYSDHGTWVDAGHAMPPGAWQQFTIRVDLEAGTYSAHAGEDEGVVLCDGVVCEIPESRFVEEPGVNKPIPVPVYKMFRQVYFAPDGPPGSATCLDDLSLTWVPTLHYREPGKRVYFADDFEAHAPGGQLDGTKATRGGKWEVRGGPAESYVIENRTSFGDGVKCVVARGGADLVAVGKRKLRLGADPIVTVDLDVFIRSSSTFPYMIPDPLTKSPHRTTVGLESALTGGPVATLRAGDGTWECWDGEEYSDSGVRIAYDVWNHLQLAVDSSTGTYQVVAQPVGELPTLVGGGRLGQGAEGDVVFAIRPSDSDGHVTCYDNLLITGDGA
ncbi:MAG TPA: hypothetical protein QGH10_25590, partial [Armatimonadota bacterium]|nr:hypothetical protein [Armatimonadota bacterium]